MRLLAYPRKILEQGVSLDNLFQGNRDKVMRFSHGIKKVMNHGIKKAMNHHQVRSVSRENTWLQQFLI